MRRELAGPNIFILELAMGGGIAKAIAFRKSTSLKVYL
jgi:hypothetical protein